MRKIISLALCLLLIFTLCACNNSNNPTEPNSVELSKMGEVYSVGLTDDGYYIDYDELLPDFEYTPSVYEQDLVAAIADILKVELGPDATFDQYLELYANDFLSAMGIDRKEVVESSDAVVVSLLFTNNKGEEMPEYTQTSQKYVVSETADAIVSSFVGHKVGDHYTTEYTFPQDDEYHPNETVTVDVTIEDIYFSDALHSGVVEAHLDELNEVLVGVTDAETLKNALYPYVLGYHLEGYIEEQAMSADIAVPAEWVKYEEERLGHRLDALNMTREQYLSEMNYTEADITKSCEHIVRENIITMTEYRKMFAPLTEDDLKLAYGEDKLDYYVSLQGYPYLKLRLMRSMVFAELAKTTPVLDSNGEAIDLSLYFGTNDSVSESVVPENTETTNE